MIETITLSFSSGLVTGVVCGLLLMLVFKKDFWRVASLFYRKTVGEIGFLQSEVKKYKQLVETAYWFKDKKQYDEKFALLQEKTWKVQKQLEKNSSDREEIELAHSAMMEAHDSLHRRIEEYNRNIAWTTREFE